MDVIQPLAEKPSRVTGDRFDIRFDKSGYVHLCLQTHSYHVGSDVIELQKCQLMLPTERRGGGRLEI